MKKTRRNAAYFVCGAVFLTVLAAAGYHHVWLRWSPWVEASSGVGEASGSSTVSPNFAANGVQVSRSSDTDREQLDPAIVSDGSSGAIFAFEDDNATDGTYNIYAQRFGSTGTAFWVSGGVRLAASSSNQTDPIAISNGSGGAVVLWTEGGGGTPTRIVGVGINSSGTVTWGPTSFFVHPDVGGVCLTSISPSGAGGLVLGWIRNDSGTYTSQTTAINSSGTLLWTTAGLTQGADCTKIPVYADTVNNAAYSLFPESTGRNWAYVQKYNLTTGVAQYAGNGVQVGVPGQADYALGIGTNGSSGFHAIVGGDRSASCGMFCNNSSSTIRAVRGNDSATSTVTLMADELYASSYASSFYDTSDPGQAVGDSSGNMYIVSTWVDSGQQGTVVAQKVTSGGVNSWGASITGGSGSMGTALAIDTDTDQTANAKIHLDGTGGAYVAWSQIAVFLGDDDLYAQRIDAAGSVQWSAATQRVLNTDDVDGEAANVALTRTSTTPWFVWDRNNDIYTQSGTEVAGSSGSSSNTNTSTGSGTAESGYSVPLKPIAGTPIALSPTSIRWQFSDTSEYESGFQLNEEADGQVPRILRTTYPVFTKNLSFFDETGLLPNQRYCDRVVYAFNDKGISLPSNKLGCAFTQVYPPGQPVSSIINPLTRRVSWTANGNPPHTEYAILEKVRGYYVQADGTFGGTPAWRTLTQWGPDGVIVHLPSAGAPYSFAVQSRNGDGVATPSQDTNFQNPAATLLIERRVSIQPPATDGSVPEAFVYLDDGKAVRKGELLLYQTFVKNQSSRDAQSFVLADPIPVGTTYVPGSIDLNGTTLTDAVGDDAGSFDGGAVVVTQPTLAAGRMLQTSYAVAVTAPTGNIVSRTCASSLENPDGQCSNSAVNPVVGALVVNTNTNANTNIPVNTNTNANRPVNTNVNAPEVANTNTNAPVEEPEEPDAAAPQAGQVLVNGRPPDQPTNDPSPEIAGTTDPETRVVVTVDGVTVGTAVSDGQGNYVVDMAGTVGDGGHRLVIRADGEVVFEGDFVIDTLPPPPPLTLGLDIVKIGVVRRSGIENTIVEVSGETTPETALVRLIIQSDPVVVTFPPPALVWTKQVEAPLEAGEHTATAIAIDTAGNESDPVTRTFIVPELDEEPTVTEQLAEAVAELRVFLDQPAVQTVNTVVAPVVAVAAVANMATAAGFGTLYGFLGFLFTQPALLFARRKRKGYGTVYNAFSKLPVDLAIVRIRDAATQRVQHTKVTDKEGRYMFFLPPGGYAVEVVKPGFAYPSQVLRGVTEDPAFIDILPTPAVHLETATRLVKNLPVDPVGGERTPAAIRAAAAARRFQHLFAASGPALSVVSFAVTPTLPVGLIVVLQIAAYALFRRLAYVAPPKSYGIVWNAKTQQPLPGVAVRIFEATYNKLLETQVTDARGRYAFLVGRNRFYVTASAPGFMTFRSPPIDRTTGEERSIITNTISLTPGTDAPPAPPAPSTPVTSPQPPSLPPSPPRPPHLPPRPTPTANRPPVVAPQSQIPEPRPLNPPTPPSHGSV